MNNRAVQFFGKVFCAVGANASRILSTFVLTLLLPKMMSVLDYSYWQLYGFYGIYLACSSLGWCEGYYLQYGGRSYHELDRRNTASQFWLLAGYECLFALCAYAAAASFVNDESKLQAFGLALVFTVVSVLRYQQQTVLQASGRIAEYAKVYAGERAANFVLVLFCVVSGNLSFRSIACMEIISNTLMLLYAGYLCREVTFQRPLPLRESCQETKKLIMIGYKLTLASLASQLIIGIVRFAIEQKWGTVVFGKISLSFSMANMMITCISAVSIVLFPIFRNVSVKKLEEIYSPIRTGITVPMFGILLIYVPLKMVLGFWLPQYRDSIQYLAILFPLCVFETRNMVLVWTYLKTIRREYDIMKANLTVAAVSLFTTGLVVYVLQNLELAVISIIVLHVLKAFYTEGLLMKNIRTEGRETGRELLLTAVFIAGNWMLKEYAAFGCYLCAYVLYLIMERRELAFSIKMMKKLLLTGRTE